VRSVDAEELGESDDYEPEGDSTSREGAISLEQEDPKNCQYNAGSLGED
jgi:hypothetical protein